MRRLPNDARALEAETTFLSMADVLGARAGAIVRQSRHGEPRSRRRLPVRQRRRSVLLRLADLARDCHGLLARARAPRWRVHAISGAVGWLASVLTLSAVRPPVPSEAPAVARADVLKSPASTSPDAANATTASSPAAAAVPPPATSAPDPGSAPPLVPDATAAAPPARARARRAAPNGVSLQRAAADALAEGRHADALDSYRELASSSADAEVYARLIDIIERRLQPPRP